MGNLPFITCPLLNNHNTSVLRMNTLKLLVILSFSFLAKFCLNLKESNEFYYKAPHLNIKFMNMTLGIASAKINNSPKSYIGGLVAAICQADKLNRNAYPSINFTGLINLAIQDFDSSDIVGQNAMWKLLSNSLYNETTNAPMPSNRIDNLAGFIGLVTSGQNRINAEAGAGYSLSFLNPGTSEQVNPEDQFAIYSKEELNIYYSIRNTVEYSNINVLISLMAAYNWTIGANMYQDNSYGLGMQQQVQTFVSIYPSPIFTCNYIIGKNDLLDPNFYKKYCQCMTEINTLNLLSLWMSPALAYQVIAALKHNCKAAEEFIYIVTSESKPLPYDIYYNDKLFKSLFIIRPFGGLNFTSFVNECFETSSPQAVASMDKILQEFLAYSYNCYRPKDAATNLPQCTGDIFNRTETCICTGSEFNPELNPYSAQNFFYADAVSSFVQVVSLLQENCTAINEALLSLQGKHVSNFDFCKFDNITPGLLTGLLALTNFTGYTGPISYEAILGNTRSVKPFYLYNVHTTVRDAIFVGEFSIDGYYIDFSNVLLPSGNDTISALVPDNPSISIPFIAAFFGLFIVLTLATFIAFGLLFCYKDHILIRKNTPHINFIVLLGLAFINIGTICICFGAYDWSCNIFFLFHYCFGSLVIGGIIAKSYRIYRIFRNKSAKALILTDNHLFAIIGAISLYFFLIYIFAVCTNYGAYELVSKANVFYLYIQCKSSSNFWEEFIIILVLVSGLVFKIVALCLACLTRRVVTTYSESFEIIIIISVYVCVDITIIPLYFELGNGSNSATLRTVLILTGSAVATTCALVILFYRRFFLLYRYERKKRGSLLYNRVISETNSQ